MTRRLKRDEQQLVDRPVPTPFDNELVRSSAKVAELRSLWEPIAGARAIAAHNALVRAGRVWVRRAWLENRISHAQYRATAAILG